MNFKIEKDNSKTAKNENKPTLIKRLEPFFILFGGVLFNILPCFKSNVLNASAESKLAYMLGTFTGSLVTNLALSGIAWLIAYLIMRKRMKMTRGYLFIIIFGIVSFALYNISR